jgi:N-acetylneuraminic acid mutarotase
MIPKILTTIIIALFLFSCSKHDSPPPSNNNPNPQILSISAFSPASAPIDSVVTLSGANFNPDKTEDTVKFNDSVAIVESATSSQLVVLVPPGATTGKISVTTGNQTATSATNFIVGDQWTLLNAYPGSLMANVVSFQIGTKFYVGLGEGAGISNLGVWSGEFWQYDAVSGGWSQKANYPGIATGYGVGFSVAGEGYVVMNPDTNGHNSLWQYDTASNKWSQKADFPGSPELGIVAFGLNNYGYVGLGVLSEYGTNAFYQYDPASDTWTQKGNYPGAVTNYAASFVIGNYAYVGTGLINLNTSSGSTEFYQYDPSTDTWTQKGNFPGGGRNWAAGFSIGGYGYLAGGLNTNGVEQSDFWQYDPGSDSWTQKKAFGGGTRFEASAFSGTSQGYLGFGQGAAHQIEPGNYSGTYVDLWQYQP